MPILSTLESTTLDETIRCASKWLIVALKTQNLELVSIKCVTYAQPIPLSLTPTRFITKNEYSSVNSYLTYMLVNISSTSYFII